MNQDDIDAEFLSIVSTQNKNCESEHSAPGCEECSTVAVALKIPSCGRHDPIRICQKSLEWNYGFVAERNDRGGPQWGCPWCLRPAAECWRFYQL